MFKFIEKLKRKKKDFITEIPDIARDLYDKNPDIKQIVILTEYQNGQGEGIQACCGHGIMSHDGMGAIERVYCQMNPISINQKKAMH